MAMAAAVDPFIKIEGRVLQTSLMCTQQGDDYCLDVVETLDDDGKDVHSKDDKDTESDEGDEGECEPATWEMNSCTDLGECADVQGVSSCCQMTETIMELEMAKFLCPYVGMLAKELGAEAITEMMNADPDCPVDFDALCSMDTMALLSRGMSLVRSLYTNPNPNESFKPRGRASDSPNLTLPRARVSLALALTLTQAQGCS